MRKSEQQGLPHLCTQYNVRPDLAPPGGQGREAEGGNAGGARGHLGNSTVSMLGCEPMLRNDWIRH